MGLTLEQRATEVPQEIRKLTGLQSLYLGDSNLERLPSWLNELPNLKEIDISSARVTELPSFLPNIRWGVDAQQILSFGNRLDSRKIFSIAIDTETSQEAIQHVFDLGRRGALELSLFRVATGINHPAGPEQWKEKWPFFDIIDSQLDEFLETCQKLRELILFGCPIGRIPEPIRRMRDLTSIMLVGVRPAAIPDWLFEALELTVINLGFNSLSVLPDSIGEARYLEHLGLGTNQFKRVPAGVWKLAALETLDLQPMPHRGDPCRRTAPGASIQPDAWPCSEGTAGASPRDRGAGA